MKHNEIKEHILWQPQQIIHCVDSEIVKLLKDYKKIPSLQSGLFDCSRERPASSSGLVSAAETCYWRIMHFGAEQQHSYVKLRVRQVSSRPRPSLART